MKALVFAAGLGTRLKPLTDSIPKALVPINGIPLLKHVILKLKTAGVSEVIINIHHKGEQIIDYVRTEHAFGIRVEFSDERGQLLDTGGGIRFASWFFDDQPFYVHNVDILSTIDLADFYRFHQKSGALVSLFASKRRSSRYLLFDEKNELKAWINDTSGESKPTGVKIDDLKKYAFNGIHVISPALFQYMNKWEGKFSIIDFYLSLAQHYPIQLYSPANVEIIDVGKPESLAAAGQFAHKIQL